MSWLQTNTDNTPGGSGSYMSRAASLGRGLAVHICLLHRERAKVAADDPTRTAELDDMRDKARIAIAGDPSINVPGFQQTVEDMIRGRDGTLQFLTGTWTDEDSGW